MSEKHPKCDKCDYRLFNNKYLINVSIFKVFVMSLLTLGLSTVKHYISSPRHHYCSKCNCEFDKYEELEEVCYIMMDVLSRGYSTHYKLFSTY